MLRDICSSARPVTFRDLYQKDITGEGSPGSSTNLSDHTEVRDQASLQSSLLPFLFSLHSLLILSQYFKLSLPSVFNIVHSGLYFRFVVHVCVPSVVHLCVPRWHRRLPPHSRLRH